MTSFLVLHGGGGPATVATLVDHLSTLGPTAAPTHPGWEGTELDVTSVRELAQRYLAALTEPTIIVGSSLGGWLAAEMAVLEDSGAVAGIVIIDGVGIEVAGEPIRDFFALDARGVAEFSWHDPQLGYRDPALLPPERLSIMRASMAAMRVIAGDPYMHSPDLRDQLSTIGVPALVVWGESDRIATPDYGRAFARAIPGASFELIERAGHLPQLERPAETFVTIDTWLATLSRP